MVYPGLSRVVGEYRWNKKRGKKSLRPLRLEPLEDRRLLAGPSTADMDGDRWAIELVGEGEPTPTFDPDLLDLDDTGVFNNDNRTNLDNSGSDKTLRFSVGNTVVGATVTLYADGTAIGNATATSSTTIVTSDGVHDLVDGVHDFTARQTLPGEGESIDSGILRVTVDTSIPDVVVPMRLGGYDTAGFAWNVTVVGNHAYVADGSYGLQIINVSNPASPVWQGSYNTSGNAYDVAVVNDRAYVADGDSGLQIIDVSNPAAPVRLGGYDTNGSTRGVTVVNDLAYIGDGYSGLQIVNVSNPAAPVLRGRYNTSGFARDIAVVNNRAYVADGGHGLQIIDVSNPIIPVWLGEYSTGGYVNDVAVVDDVAYLADDDLSLQIIDVSNPTAPVHLGSYGPISNSVMGVVVVDGLAYVTDADLGLQIVDVSKPAAPVLLGNYDTGDYALGVAVVGNLAYVIDNTAGLQIVSIFITPDLQSSSDTGASNIDNITHDNTPTFDISGSDGNCFRFYRNGLQISDDFESGVSYTAPVQAAGTYSYTYTLIDTAGNATDSSVALTVTISDSTVVGRYVYYPESYWGSDPAPDKRALTPGHENAFATFANVVSHPQGIRGIYIDVDNLFIEPTVGDFEFRIGGNASNGSVNPTLWPALTVEPAITMIPNGGINGSDRVALEWPAGVIRNTWLEVKMFSTGDIFYFANAVGETNESVTGRFLVNAADLTGTRDNPRTALNRAPIDFRYDFNRDGLVNASDFGIVRDNPTTTLTAVKTIALPALSPTQPPAAAPEGEPLVALVVPLEKSLTESSKSARLDAVFAESPIFKTESVERAIVPLLPLKGNLPLKRVEKVSTPQAEVKALDEWSPFLSDPLAAT